VHGGEGKEKIGIDGLFGRIKRKVLSGDERKNTARRAGKKREKPIEVNDKISAKNEQKELSFIWIKQKEQEKKSKTDWYKMLGETDDG